MKTKYTLLLYMDTLVLNSIYIDEVVKLTNIELYLI